VLSPSKVDVTPGYFEAMGVTLLRGRLFDGRDGPDAPKVIIVDETMAKHFWPGQDPIGHRMYFPTSINELLAITDKTVFFTVVGVIREMKLDSLAGQKTDVGAYYFPMAQEPARYLTFALRSAGTGPTAFAGSLRAAIAAQDRELPIFDMQTMSQLTDKSLVSRRSPVLLSLSFGAIALFLSAIGIYGVLAYLVTQRTKELGIRIALGSSAGAIFELVLKEGLLLVLAGFAVGGAGAFALRRSLESQLFGVSATDPLVLGAVTALLAIVALAACALPARRATRIDPIVALSE